MLEAFVLALLFSVAFGVMSAEEMIEKGESRPQDRLIEYFAFSSFMLIMVFPIFAFSAVVGTIVMLPVLLVSVVGFLAERRKRRCLL